MSLSVARPYRKPLIDVPPYPFYSVASTAYEHGVSSEADISAIFNGYSDQMASNVDGDVVTLNVVDGSWGYLVSPVSNGAITFVDPAINMVGGWDGATWPTDGSIGEQIGPATVSLDFGAGYEDWYLYRTDFQGIGQRSWKLRYAREQ